MTENETASAAAEENWQSRQIALIGEAANARLRGARTAVFGCGGVGGYVLEALARAGVGMIAAVDFDRISDSNRNRQILADLDTVGEKKAEAAVRRIKKINPAADAEAVDLFITAENAAECLDRLRPDCIADAVDNVTAKLALITAARDRNIPVISCMGTGNKLDAGRLRIADLSQTDTCPLARVMRRELRTRGITHLPVLYSDEPPRQSSLGVPASVSYVPAVAGFLIGGWMIRRLIGEETP